MTFAVSKTYVNPALPFLPHHPSHRAMVNKDSPLLQKHSADRDRARRNRRTCADAIGPTADAHRLKQRVQHQQRQARYSERSRRALPARVSTNTDHMDIEQDFIQPPPPRAFLPSHQHDAIDDFFSRLLFTKTDPPQCSTCFEQYHGMRLQGTECDRCYREGRSRSAVCLLLHTSAPADCPSTGFPPLHKP